MKKKKIRALELKSGKIIERKTRDEEVSFNFKYLNFDNQKFCKDIVFKHDSRFFQKFLDRLKSLSSWKMRELISDGSDAIRFHPIIWEETSEPNGFSQLGKFIDQFPPYQFEISQKTGGRIHGFIIDSTFYIVWFDPIHQLYPKEN